MLGDNALIVSLGVVKDEASQPKSCLFHLWLLAYEFSETAIGFTNSKVVFLTSKRKKEIIEKISPPVGYKGPKIEVILRDQKNECFGKFFKALNFDKSKIAMFANEKPVGPFCADFTKHMNDMNIEFTDADPIFREITCTKTAEDLASTEVAAKFSDFAMKELVGRIESIIDI